LGPIWPGSLLSFSNSWKTVDTFAQNTFGITQNDPVAWWPPWKKLYTRLLTTGFTHHHDSSAERGTKRLSEGGTLPTSICPSILYK
jgi:hypothetical protein